MVAMLCTNTHWVYYKVNRFGIFSITVIHPANFTLTQHFDSNSLFTLLRAKIEFKKKRVIRKNASFFGLRLLQIQPGTDATAIRKASTEKMTPCSFWRRANAWHVSSKLFLRWPTYIINSVDKTKIILLYSHNDAAPWFLKKLTPWWNIRHTK